MFVSIEGCISAGKSTLSKLLSDCLEYKLVLEDYKSNRFLENFYTENNKEISFATEMEFLLLHYQQLINIDYSKNIISDFSFFSNLSLECCIRRFFRNFIIRQILISEEDCRYMLHLCLMSLQMWHFRMISVPCYQQCEAGK